MTRTRNVLKHPLGRLCVFGGLSLLAISACGDDSDDDGDRPGAEAGAGSGGRGQGGRAGGGSGGDAGAVGEAGSGGSEDPGPIGGSGGTPGEGGAAGNELGGSGGFSAGAGGGNAAGAGGAWEGGSGGADTDVGVFRPEERPFSEERLADLTVADGFEINVFAQNLGHARMLARHGEHVYLTRPMQGSVVRLTDTDEDGVADQQLEVVTNLMGVHGIAFNGDDVYLATPKTVARATVDASGAFANLTTIIDDLPDGGQHPNRTLGVGPGPALFISVGSSCDACPETNPEHATLLRSTLDGETRTIFARGLRNTIGFGWHPTTNELWGFDHGSDWRGNDLPPEELNRIENGKNYGWPYCWGDQNPDPIIQDPPDTTKEQYCATTVGPMVSYQAHSAPIGMVFYEGTQFPEEYQGDAFVAMRGSWNRLPPTGYKIARLHFEAGEPTELEDFVSGFLIEDGQAHFGRLAGVTVAPDGSLLFSDDTNGVVYRVSYPSD